ncbi:MAG: hypothetical protein OHK0031_00400 [Anaerolineales bacterium]
MTDRPFRPAQGLVEYALILSLVALAAILVLRVNGLTVAQAYCNIAYQLGSQTACAKSYCQDDFSSGLSGWNNGNGNPASGNWKPGDGQLCATGSNSILNTCSMNDMSASDYTIHLKDVVLNKGNGYGVYFRTTVVNGKINGYTFQYDPGYGGFIMRKWVNGKELPPFAFAPAKNFDYFGEPHDIDIQVSGDTFTASIDGKTVLTGHDSSYSEGGSGLRVWDSTNFCLGGFDIGPNQPGN